MKMSIQLTGCVLLSVLILIVSSSFVTGEDKPGNPKYAWLNGKWEGRPPAGGELQMTLRVEKDNQVRGTGLIPTGGRNPTHPQVTGSVNGDRVTLETFFSGAFPQVRITYNCKSAEGALECRTKSGYKTTFKKIE